ncbi:MAG: DUF1178 family protein [Desulfobacteraceae bacterium]|nr:DUF1178 family protein [Desulfobacteraceae bacterium]
MVIYDLQCPQGHQFEGWFDDAQAYEKQRAQGLLSCPVCNACDVVRVPSTFAITGVKSGAVQPPKLRSPAEAQIMTRAVMEYVENHFDNVGTEFAKEALKIHYGAAEPRNIRGVSTTQEEQTLRQEGVDFFKFPIPADSGDKPTPSSSGSESE